MAPIPSIPSRVSSLYWVPLLALLLMLVITHTAWQRASETIEAEIQASFIKKVGDAKQSLLTRMAAYQHILRGTQGLFISNTSVSRIEFHDYINSLRLAESYPGIQGVGYAPAISIKQKTQHIQSVIKDGFSEYDIKPEGERDLYAPIIYLEPFSSRNLKAFGYDMYSESTRRAALEKARDSGDLSMSGKVKLVQESGQQIQSGFLIFAPIYKHKAASNTLEQKQNNLTGWVYAPFRMGDLMAGLYGNQPLDLVLEIFDGEELSDTHLMYSSIGTTPVSQSLQVVERLNIADHTWSVRFIAPLALEQSDNTHKPRIIAIAGTAISLLISLLIYLFLNSRQLALNTSHKMTLEIQASQSDLQSSLRELEFFKLALDTHAIVSTADVSGDISFVNQKFLEISGYARDELIGNNHRMIKSNLHSQAFYENLWQTITSGKVWQGEVCNRRKTGEHYWVRATIVPLLDEAGSPERYISIRTDITQLKQTEARWAFAIEGAGDGVWDWNMLTGDMALSGRYEEMLGYKKGELEPSIDAWVRGVHPDDLARVQANLQDYLSGKLSHYVVELRLQNKKGGYTWVLCRGTVVERDSNGTPIRMIGIHSNIDQRIKDQQQLMIAKEQALAASKSKTDFLSSISHELRTPMNAILGFAQLLENDPNCSGEQRDHVQQILAAGHHLLRLINEILDLASIESGQVQIKIENLHPNQLISESLAMVIALANQKEIRIDNRLDEQTPVVQADNLRLKQVMINLLSNAIKYNQKQGLVTLKAHTNVTGQVVMTVQDSGIGMNPDELSRLFQPFTRFGDTSKISGTGNGLAISKKLIESMGGQINVKSTRGIGSEFSITLPAGNTSPSIRENQTSQLSLLCIEDDLSQRTLLGTWANKKGWHISFANDGTSGVDAAMKRHFDVILLDIELPGGFDGFDVKAVLDDVSDLKNIPVIGISSHTEQQYATRATSAGFAAFFNKPIDLQELENFLKNLQTPT